ncbi:hypothetical protein [Chitinophaga ginsengisegetis]|uniref:hypothetical protein n=1 Tax=Chitinophaga ginsengisegetis TaxID=393003 RepID=UPI000DBAB392|nr:hypothetical protein [Chitinophaga ginsengisegetis]MDR6565479.1 hypothetical protein [Chitinophaga ginsengisegetis]MDR6645207.1 hypothetical protein [Chitinophaga ginsengisegetis]MDR6652201.1 hypothetical protein [Chitinophaga ginsengisegetis]
MFITILEAGSLETFLPDLGEKLTLVACLAFFLYYFMKELKQVREAQEKQRQDYDARFQTMFERVAEMERKSMEALNNVSSSNERLADAVVELKNQLKHTTR